MELERGLQVNCSDLVTRLGGYTQREIIETLKLIEKKTGCVTCFCADTVPDQERNIPGVFLYVPVHDIVKSKAIRAVKHKGTDPDLELYLEEALGKNVPEGALPWKYSTELQDMCSKATSSWGFDLKIVKGAPKVPKFLRREITDTINISLGDGYTTYQGLIARPDSHGDKKQFPMFHRMREVFGWAEYESLDGGSTDCYEDWMEREGRKK